ncbi:MAG: Outer rane lipoproteinsorting protein, partial [Acidobacteria bacterium]|nr:Outer rane lipoproteinsorting protein [Acidobacteriota bacterium]
DWLKPTIESFSLVQENFVIYRPRLAASITGKLKEDHKKAITSFFDLSPENLKKNYNLKFVGQENVGGAVQAWRIELTPKAQSGIKTIEIWIAADGMPVQAKITEQNGDWTNVLLSDLQKNVVMKINDLKIDTPKGIKIIRN